MLALRGAKDPPHALFFWVRRRKIVMHIRFLGKVEGRKLKS